MYDVIVVGAGPAGLSAALILGRSLRRVLVCDSGTPRNAASRAMHGYLTRDGLPPHEFLRVARLARHGIRVREDRVTRLEGTNGILERVVFDAGDSLPRRALFFTTGQTQRSQLAIGLGCEFNDKGTVRTGRYESTHLPGLYV